MLHVQAYFEQLDETRESNSKAVEIPWAMVSVHAAQKMQATLNWMFASGCMHNCKQQNQRLHSRSYAGCAYVRCNIFATIVLLVYV